LKPFKTKASASGTEHVLKLLQQTPLLKVLPVKALIDGDGGTITESVSHK